MTHGVQRGIVKGKRLCPRYRLGSIPQERYAGVLARVPHHVTLSGDRVFTGVIRLE